MMPALRSVATLGKNPRAVRSVDSFTRLLGDAFVFHLTRTLEAHQKFATLSSNSPRENGNIRMIGLRIAEEDAKGGSHGRNSRIKVESVTIAS